jgi:molecular chaperone HtpG
MSKTTHAFKTEVQQLLDLVIHSLYSKKEIFLRELISNSSDAIDRARFEALTHPEWQPKDGAWAILLAVDKEAKTITISDNGIGMNAEELDANIGTIASSGTRKYLEALREQKGKALPELIGQFGVGFYSAFMVADKVTVVTRRMGAEKALRWESGGDGRYTVEDAERAEAGSDVILHLREGMDEFLDDWRLRNLVRHYSDYIAFPIRQGDQVLNSQKAIWRKAKSEVTEEEYNEFFKHVSHESGAPLKVIHYAAEGTSEFRALLFIPSTMPMDLLMPNPERATGIHLYVKNVFITDACRELCPPYLRFLRGVVDSSDLPLNVSREMLQDNAAIRRIRKSLVGKILNTLGEMRDLEADRYQSFFSEFGPILKEGLHGDFENREKLLDLLLFESTAEEPGKRVSLKTYVSRLKSEQTKLYFLVAESSSVARQSPLLETFRARGLEVLLLTDPVDSWIEESLGKYGEHEFQAVHRGDVELPAETGKDAEKESKEAAGKDLPELRDLLKAKLADVVKDVRLSKRLTDSPCCLVTDSEGMTPGMERLMKAMRHPVPEGKRILEINPGHPAVKELEAIRAADASDARLADGAELLLGQALLAEGALPKDPVKFARLVSSLMAPKP